MKDHREGRSPGTTDPPSSPSLVGDEVGYFGEVGVAALGPQVTNWTVSEALKYKPQYAAQLAGFLSRLNIQVPDWRYILASKDHLDTIRNGLNTIYKEAVPKAQVLVAAFVCLIRHLDGRISDMQDGQRPHNLSGIEDAFVGLKKGELTKMCGGNTCRQFHSSLTLTLAREKVLSAEDARRAAFYRRHSLGVAERVYDRRNQAATDADIQGRVLDGMVAWLRLALRGRDMHYTSDDTEDKDDDNDDASSPLAKRRSLHPETPQLPQLEPAPQAPITDYTAMDVTESEGPNSPAAPELVRYRRAAPTGRRGGPADHSRCPFTRRQLMQLQWAADRQQ
ncbi:hypothetical protein FJT64_018495 [Amphibalanus amphitrite]|uniref:Uncharacterized protein n=1 Tax=Amphibalanus amphitrite TaxID=1232801 RepID=A0A6A4WXB3_AMPAM|nr:hypothetical protein FJT64_018495 [Amphibalanus amphitrite]